MNPRQIVRKLAPIVYQDEQFLFVNKPAGLPSRGKSKEHPPDWLAAVAGGGERLPVYDLPAIQSGVLGFAKSREAHRHFTTGISTGSVKSAFVAVVQGRVKKSAVVVSAGIKRVGKDRFVADRPSGGESLPSTRIESLARGETRELVQCSMSGLDDRQARAHLQDSHLRIIGDLDRGQEPSKERSPLPLMLHLEEVRFHHPGLKHALSVRARVPREFQDALSSASPNSKMPVAQRSRPLAPDKGGIEATLAYRLHAALAKRLPLFLDEGTDAFRVLHGTPDGVSGLAAEVYGEVLVLQLLQGKFEDVGRRVIAIAQWYQRFLGVKAVYLKHFARDRSREAPAAEGAGPLFDPRPLVGDPAPDQFTVRESGLNFLVRPYDGYSTGLFLEQRENRRRVRELAAGRRVLNLFAYTCGFSVAAAAGGAAQTVSVDASRRHLEWGKENFRVNGLSLDDHVFILDDAFNYFKRARRQGLSFDLMIVDPPSFARMKKPRRVFTVAKDLRGLLTEALTVLAPGGIMLICTNNRELGRTWLREQVRLAAGERKVSMISAPDLPLDFAGDPDYAKSVLVRVS